MNEKEMLEKIEQLEKRVVQLEKMLNLEKRVKELEKDVSNIKEDFYVFTEEYEEFDTDETIDNNVVSGCGGHCSQCGGCEE